MADTLTPIIFSFYSVSLKVVYTVSEGEVAQLGKMVNHEFAVSNKRVESKIEKWKRKIKLKGAIK